MRKMLEPIASSQTESVSPHLRESRRCGTSLNPQSAIRNPKCIRDGLSRVRAARQGLIGPFDRHGLFAVMRLHFFAEMRNEVGGVFLLRLLVGRRDGVDRSV